MGLFGKKKSNEVIEESTEAVIEPVSRNNQDLEDLKNEFKEMRGSQGYSSYDDAETIEEEIIEDEYHGGEEYEVSEDESASIENFLSSPDEEIIEEEIVEEPAEEVVEEGELDTSSYMSRFESYDEPLEEVHEEPVDVEVDIKEYEAQEDEVAEEEVEEPVEYNYEEVQDEYEPEIEEAVEQTYIQEPTKQEAEEPANYVTSEDIDKKFDEFEKRLLEKIMASMAVINQQVADQSTQVVAKQQPKQTESADSEDVIVSYENGKLVIDGYTFNGEVVMFTPLDNVKKASWEEVVRRKGHCTYHLTTSGNGGYFIKKSNAPNPYAYIQEKEDAINLAKAYAKKEKAELKIHNAKGVIEQSLSFGREKLRG